MNISPLPGTKSAVRFDRDAEHERLIKQAHADMMLAIKEQRWIAAHKHEQRMNRLINERSPEQVLRMERAMKLT